MADSDQVSDYQPGDEPVAVGTVVRYFGSWADSSAPLYEITDQAAPGDNPNLRGAEEPVEELYPDGTAYHLWLMGKSRRFGNRQFAVYFVRRTSFSVERPAV